MVMDSSLKTKPAGQPGTTAAPSSEREQPPAAWRDEFQRLYEKPEDPTKRDQARTRGQGAEAREGSEQKDLKEDLSAIMSQIWGSTLSGQPTQAWPAEAGSVAPPAAGSDLNELVRGLVGEILVSPADQPGEVRLKVNENLLPGTEIILARDPEGLLTVSLVSVRADSFQTLVAAQDSLKAALAAQEGDDVRVTVTRTEAGAGEDGSADRRSRGLGWNDQDET
jgi:type III secretion system needle length determinant